MKALIFDGKVVQIEATEFPVAPGLTWVDTAGVTPAPEVGWAYDGTSFTAPSPLPSPPPKSAAPLTAEELATHLIAKGTINQAEVDAIKVDR